jgi:hypothetical protein
MENVYVTMEPSTEKPGWCSPTFHRAKPSNWVDAYTVSDPDRFIEHMHRYHSIPNEHLTRERYEQMCRDFGVTPKDDTDLDTYGNAYGNFGMSHYHRDPANRKMGIASTIHQLRYFWIKTTDYRNRSRWLSQLSPNKRVNCGSHAKTAEQNRSVCRCNCVIGAIWRCRFFNLKSKLAKLHKKTAFKKGAIQKWT